MSSRFDVLATPISGLSLLQRKPIGDKRGYLERLYCTDELQGLLGARLIKQVNRSRSAASGTVRGMHFQQQPYAEMKFVSCLRGEVFDVAVDLRHRSPTFLQWHAELLSAENHRCFVIPEGFAHGFQTLTDDCEMLYFHTQKYSPDHESGLNPRDPMLAIEWPKGIETISQRDASHPMLSATFLGVTV